MLDKFNGLGRSLPFFRLDDNDVGVTERFLSFDSNDKATALESKSSPLPPTPLFKASNGFNLEEWVGESMSLTSKGEGLFLSRFDLTAFTVAFTEWLSDVKKSNLASDLSVIFFPSSDISKTSSNVARLFFDIRELLSNPSKFNFNLFTMAEIELF